MFSYGLIFSKDKIKLFRLKISIFCYIYIQSSFLKHLFSLKMVDHQALVLKVKSQLIKQVLVWLEVLYSMLTLDGVWLCILFGKYTAK